MTTLRTNRKASLPSLVSSILIENDATFSLLDIGASGGIDAQWRLFGKSLRATGFDPLIDEIDRLNKEAESGEVYHASFIGRPPVNAVDEVTAKTNATYNRTSSVAAQHLMNESYAQTYYNKGKPIRLTEHWVELDTAVSDMGLNETDFIKIDTDGGDFGVLKSATDLLSSGNILGLSVECQLHGPVTDDANVFCNIDRLLRAYGFSLYDLDLWRYARSVLPTDFVYNIPAQTVSGQVQWGEAVYFRDLADPGYADKWPQSQDLTSDPFKILKLAALFEMYGLSDCAAELLQNRKSVLSDIMSDADIIEWLDMLSRGVDVSGLDLSTRQARFEESVRRQRYKGFTET